MEPHEPCDETRDLLGVEVVGGEAVVELLDELVVLHGLVNQLLVFFERLGDGLHPLPDLGQLLNAVGLLVELATDEFEVFAGVVGLLAKLPCEQLEYCVAECLALLGQGLAHVLGVDPEGSDDDGGGQRALQLLLLLEMVLHLRLHLRRRVALRLVGSVTRGLYDTYLSITYIRSDGSPPPPSPPPPSGSETRRFCKERLYDQTCL